jgi:hypothetical protein
MQMEYFDDDLMMGEIPKRKPVPVALRSLSTIAMEVRRNWANVNYAAEPYLSAMARMNLVTDEYGHDSGKGIVLRFLGNARAWRGEVAKRVKAELKAML